MFLFALPCCLWPQEDDANENSSTEQVENEDSGENTWYVNIDSSSPDAVLQDGTDFFEQQPIGRLLTNQPVTVLEEEDGEYVKIKAVVDGKDVEGWIKKIVLVKKPLQNKRRVTESGATESAAFASNASMGRVKFDDDPWQHIDPTSADAKLKGSPVPYHLIIPAGILVAGGGLALALALANKDSDPDPDPPIDDPIVDDPDFSLLNDSYSVICGQSLLVYPLQNDVGTGLVITGINGAPEGVELLNDTTVSIPSTLSEEVSFTIVIADEVGQTGISTVNVTVNPVDIAANNDLYEINQGDAVADNVLDNDLCFGCEVIETSGDTGTLEMSPNGDFQYFSPADFWGEVVYAITIQNPCGAEDTSDLIFIISPTDCDLVMSGDTLWLNAGETIEGNLLDNDICTDCVVTSTSDAEGTLEWDAEGNFSYTAPDNFEGQVVFMISVTDACDQEGTQNLVFIIENTPCAFEWGGQVETISAGCGISDGTAFATEELFGPYNFLWSNGVEGSGNTDIPADSYQLFVTDTTTGCVDTLDAMVGELPPDYALDFETLTGECGATDNVQLFTNANPDQPLIIALSGATEEMIENVTDPAIWLGDFVALNPGPHTITVWGEEAGPECAQSIDLVLEQATTPELVVLDTGPDFIVLEINNALYPVEIFVNGEPFLIAEEPMVFLEGLPPGIYEIFGVDATGCAAPVVVADIEGGGIHKPDESVYWNPQATGLNSWIHSPDQLIMQTVEGQEGYFPIGGQLAIPVFIEISKGQWVAAITAASAVYQSTDGAGINLRRVNYLEVAAGRQLKVFDNTVSIKLGSALWNQQGDAKNNLRGWFVDGAIPLKLKSTPGRIQVGFRVGLIETSPQIMVMPSVQYSFSK